MATLKTKIVLRNDLAAQWQQYNPVLLAGEAGVEVDTGLFKIGDGVTAWNSLDYANNQISLDNKTITKDAESGALTLKDWQKKYFKWDSTSNSYVETAGWIPGLEPRAAADGTLSWYEPNTSTVTGLESAIAALQEQDNLHTEAIDLLLDESKNYLTKEGGALTGDLVLADGYKAASERVVETKIEAAINSAGHIKRVIVDELPPVEEANANTIYMVRENGGFVEWMLIDGVFEEIGNSDIDLSSYVQKVENATPDNIAILTEDGALVDGGLAIDAVKNHLENTEVHISSEERAAWNEGLLANEENTYALTAMRASMETKKFSISGTPVGTKINYSDSEIRVMVPANTIWKTQNVGSTGDANMYYMAFHAYAPDNAVSFKEGDQGSVENTIHTFDEDFAGIDEFGRKYSIIWLALAKYDADTNTWLYFGKNSTASHYIGWNYVVEWYDENGNIIFNDHIRINLSNENCHNATLPYYMGGVIKQAYVNGTLLDVLDNSLYLTTSNFIKDSDEIVVNEDHSLSIKSISTSKLRQDENEELILNGGGAML